MRKTVFGVAGFALAAMIGAGSAHAGLIGDSINVQYIFPTAGTVFENDGTQTAPSTFSLLGGEFSLTVSNTSITLKSNVSDSFNGTAFNGPEIIDLTHSSITNALFDAASTIVGFKQSDISFTGNTIELNMEGLPFSVGQVAIVDVVTATAVPEPASLALFGAGLLGLAAMRRRRSS